MKHKHRNRKLLAIVLFLLISGSVLAAIHRWEQQEVPREPAADQNGSGQTRQSLLILGLEENRNAEQTGESGSQRQPVVLMVMILDREKQTCDLLQLNGDTVTELRQPGTGDMQKPVPGRLAQAYAAGSGGSDSCLHVKRAVSDLLGAPIDHYLSLDLEAVGMLGDLAGGVPVEVTEDFRALNPDLEEGTTVILTGETAMGYLCARPDAAVGPDRNRTERQRQYFEALLQQIRNRNREDPELLKRALVKIGTGMQTDCSVYQLADLARQLTDCTVHPMVTVPGKTGGSDGTAEFYPDPEALRNLAEELFP